MGGVCPVPGVVGTVVGVEHIVARILQVLGGPLGFLHVAADLGVFLTGNRTLGKALELGFHGVAQRNGEVLAAGFLDGLDHLHRKTVAVLKASAVLVGALVEEFDGELVQQVALVHRVYLHAVHPCVAAELSGLGEGLDDLVDLLHRHLGAFNIGSPAGGLGAGTGQFVAGVNDGLDQGAGELVLVQGAHQLGDGPGAAHTCGQLDEELGAGLVDLLHKDTEIVEHLLVLPEPLAPEGVAEGGNAGDDQANVVLCALEEEFCGFPVKLAAGELEPAEEGSAPHGTEDNAVFDFHIADLPRGKESIILGICLRHCIHLLIN